MGESGWWAQGVANPLGQRGEGQRGEGQRGEGQRGEGQRGRRDEVLPSTNE